MLSPVRPVISFGHVTVRFGATTALDDVSLDVHAGDRVAIVGGSGSGKTTLLSLASGQRKPTRGTVERAAGTRIGLLLQDPVASLDPSWSIERLVAEPLLDAARKMPPGERQAAVRRALAAVRLGSVSLDRRPDELSVGQCQRVALARALVGQPSLLLADEPTSALDPSVAAGVLRVLDETLTATGAAFLVVSHDLMAVAPLVHRMVVLEHGRIVEQGSPTDLLQRPQYAATALLAETAHRLTVTTT